METPVAGKETTVCDLQRRQLSPSLIDPFSQFLRSIWHTKRGVLQHVRMSENHGLILGSFPNPLQKALAGRID